jgi:hypothetical protein
MYDRPDTDDNTPDPYGDNYPFDDEPSPPMYTKSEQDYNRPQLELLPGATANYTPASYPKNKITAIKAIRSDYGAELGLAYYKYNIDRVYPEFKYWGAAIKYQPSTEGETRDNPQVEQIETLRDLQRQMLDILDGLKECRDDIERNGNGGIASRLDTYVIAHIECATTSEHGWLDSSTSIDSIIEELEDE